MIEVQILYFLFFCTPASISTRKLLKAKLSISRILKCCTVVYSTVQHSTVQYSTVQYSKVQYSIVQYNTVQYSTVLYSTITPKQTLTSLVRSVSHN